MRRSFVTMVLLLAFPSRRILLGYSVTKSSPRKSRLEYEVANTHLADALSHASSEAYRPYVQQFDSTLPRRSPLRNPPQENNSVSKVAKVMTTIRTHCCRSSFKLLLTMHSECAVSGSGACRQRCQRQPEFADKGEFRTEPCLFFGISQRRFR